MHKKLIMVVICSTLLPVLLQASQNIPIPMVMKNHFTSSHDLPEYFKQAGLTDEVYKQYVNEIVDKQYADAIDDENFDIGHEIDAIHHKIIDYISPLVRKNFEPKLHAVLFDILNNPSKNIEKINEYTYQVSLKNQVFLDKQADEILNDAVLHRKLNFQIYPVLEFMISTKNYKPSVMQFIVDNFTITQKVTGVDRVNQSDAWKTTHLMIACEDTSEHALLRVQFLIHCKADLNAKDRDNWTPLMCACQNEGLQAFNIVQYLVEKGADLNLQNQDGRTALMFGCKNQGPQAFNIVQYLVGKGVDLNLQSKSWETALMYACHNEGQQAFEIVQYLIEKGADLNFQNQDGRTAFQDGNTSLMRACHNEGPQAFDIVKYLVGKGADLNIKDENGETALMFACANRGSHAFNMVKYLLDCGADKNVRNQSGKVAVDVACTQEIKDLLYNYQPKVS